MNDEFMYASRPGVRTAFSEELYHRLNQKEKGTTMEKGMKGRNKLNWKLVLAAILIAIAGIFVISPKARVFAGRLIDEITGFFVEEQTENPLAEYFDEDGVLDAPNATVVFITPEAVKSILQNPPFEFSLPTYVIEGFEIKADYAASFGSSVTIPYQRSDVKFPQFSNKEILLIAETGTPTLSIGVGASEEIMINDQPALLVRGDWARDNSHTWDYDSGWTIYWTVDTTNYRLILRGIDKDLLDDYLIELIKMAESVH